MTAHQDDKLAKMRTALSVTDGTISDLEVLYVQDLGVAIASATAVEAWMEFWDEAAQGPIAAGAFDDRAFAWLGGLGHAGSLTDRWALYWAA